jgi:hypothetical protein
MRRLPISLLAALLALLVLASPALAENDGRGFYGATDDRAIVYGGFILIIFFPTLVLVLTLIQKRLDRRKEERKAAEKAHLGDPRWRGGW